MPSKGTTSPELLIELDRSKPRGLRAQVEDELRAAIRSGRLAPGTTLPSSRAFAHDLGVTRGVVVDAYDQLVAEGYLRSQHGSGTVVNAAAPRARRPSRPVPVRPIVDVDFRPGLPDLDLFPRTAWLRAAREAMQTMARDELGYIDPRGLVGLRQVLADYLARVRGVHADVDRIVVCNGYGHGLSLVATVLRDLGHTAVAIEEPGYDGNWIGLAAAGLKRRTVPVDRDGMDVERLARTRARAVVLAPAHQNPTGAVLSPERRTAVVEWARTVDGYVIEDDYDAEHRYDRHPTGAIQGLDPDRVVYCGTTSKSLAPGLRLGWLVLPAPLVERVVEARRVTDLTTSTVLQATYAAFLSRGDLDRHLRRMRATYRQRRDALVAALAEHLPEATPVGASAGLHLLATLPDDVDERRLAELTLEQSVRVYPLSDHRVDKADDAERGLVLGYGSVTPERSERGIRTVAECLQAMRTRS
jgi:GntR family transcriptional regulator / MocR family aminotransferase